ncbi:MAG TPA: hypothetical protein VNO21_04290, partial [Polyangiaceae bacterium]|nr:hypothetical protein [Polyangiaceae bacterium]
MAHKFQTIPMGFAPYLVFLAACAGARPTLAPQHGAAPARPELLYEERPAVWFEASMTPARISPDGRRAVYGSRDAFKVIDLRTGQRDTAFGVDSASFAAFAANGDLVVLGRRGAESGWFARTGEAARLLDIPSDADPLWSPTGDRIAYTLRAAPEQGLFVGIAGSAPPHALGGRITGFTWLPDGGALLAMVVQRDDPRGGSSLVRLDAASGRVDTIARDLDAAQRFSRVAAAPDGQHAYVALASALAPVPEQRHQPNADRDLDIYDLDLASGVRRAVVATSAEESAPFVADGYLYWTATIDEASVVVLPVGGGSARTVVRGAQVPTWRPDGRAIGFTYGT